MGHGTQGVSMTFKMTRILALFTVGLLPFVAQAAEDVACAVVRDVDRCLYVCESTPTIVYTTTSFATVTQAIPCTNIPIRFPSPSGAAKQKRVFNDPCTQYVGCGACPLPTVAKTSLITTTSTVTKNKFCATPTSTVIPTSTKHTTSTKPATSTKSTLVPTPTSLVLTLVPSTSTKSPSGTKITVTPTSPPSITTPTSKSQPTCSYVCTVQSGSPSTVNPGDPYDEVIVCKQQCPISIS